MRVNIFCLIFFIQIFPNTINHGLNNLKINTKEKLSKTGYIDGDFIIGALFPIHGQPLFKNNRDPLECDEIKQDEGIQLAEAAFYAIDVINNDSRILPGIKLGINIKDDCWSKLVALYQTIKILEEPKLQNEKLYVSPFTCPVMENKNSSLIGVVRTGSSGGMLQAQNLLKLYKIPQIGYSDSTLIFSSSYFDISVVPNDYHRAYLIIKILKKYNWNYISIVYEDEPFGMSGQYFFENWSFFYNICIANSVLISSSTSINKTHSLKIDQLFKNDKAKVIVCFCNQPVLNSIFETMKKENQTGEYLILGSMDWPIDRFSVTEYAEQAHGSIIISDRKIHIPEFDEYFLSKNLQNNKRNPWFREFWEYEFDCSMDADPSSIKCTGEEQLRKKYQQCIKVSYVMKSIYSFAYALHNMHLKICPNTSEICSKMKHFNTTLYMEYLRNLNFSFYGDEVNFRYNGSPTIGKYDIYNLQNTQRSLHLVKIGEYDCHHIYKDIKTEKQIYQDVNIFSEIQYPGNLLQIKSDCSEACPSTHIQVFHNKNKCCWNCVPCKENQILLNKFTCEICSEGFWPNFNKTECLEIPLTYPNWSDTKSIIINSISAANLLITLIFLLMFITYRNTPVISSSNPALHYIIFLGAVMSNSVSLTITTKPTIITCTLKRSFHFLSFSLVFTPIFVKLHTAVRILKQSERRFPKRNMKLISLNAQFYTTLILIAIQIIIGILTEWYDFTKPVKIYQKNSPLRGYMACKFPSLMISNYITMILITISIYYAIKVKNLSNNFKELKFLRIFIFVMSVTCAPFRMAYEMSSFQAMAICIYGWIKGYWILSLVIFPKLYIIIWQPHKNNSDKFQALTMENIFYNCTITKKKLKSKFTKNYKRR